MRYIAEINKFILCDKFSLYSIYFFKNDFKILIFKIIIDECGRRATKYKKSVKITILFR